MSSPQLEDGYTRIANELLEAIFRCNFSQNEFRVILAIMRHTYGWRKKTAELSLSFLVKSSGVPRRSVAWAITNLREKNVIIRTKSNTGIQKDYDKWLVQPIALVQPVTLSPIALEIEQPVAPFPVQPIAHKKEREKKAIKKTTISLLEYTEDFLTFWDAYPRQEGKGKAFESFSKSNLNGDMPVVLEAIEAYKKTEQWQTPKYIPLPATWLNQRRWEDNPTPFNGGTSHASYELTPEEAAVGRDQLDELNRDRPKYVSNNERLRLERRDRT